MARPRKDIDESLGERIRRLRSAKGYTEAELGKAIGTSHRMIAYYEVQGGNPPADVIVKLAQALGVSADELLGLAPPRKNRAASAEPDDLRLLRKLKQVKQLEPRHRRSVVQLIDALAEREALKKARA